MKIKFLVLFCLLLVHFNFFAQEKANTTSVVINFKFNNNEIVLGEKYVSKNNDTLTFETIKMYLSSFEFVSIDNVIKTNKNYHLLDIEDLQTLEFSILKELHNNVTALKFNIGIDSLTSVSGAMSDDLDATKGMYWSWQSGFINMKIEGISKSCKTRKNKYQFHIGGYLQSNYALRTIEIPITKNHILNNKIIIKIDLAPLFDNIKLKDTNTIMIPGKEAMNIANLSTKIFSLE